MPTRSASGRPIAATIAARLLTSIRNGPIRPLAVTSCDGVAPISVDVKRARASRGKCLADRDGAYLPWAQLDRGVAERGLGRDIGLIHDSRLELAVASA